MLEVGAEEQRFLSSFDGELSITGEEFVCIEDMEVQIISNAVSTHGVIPDSQMRVG